MSRNYNTRPDPHPQHSLRNSFILLYFYWKSKVSYYCIYHHTCYIHTFCSLLFVSSNIWNSFDADRSTNRPTDIAIYRATIAVKKLKSSPNFNAGKVGKAQISGSKEVLKLSNCVLYVFHAKFKPPHTHSTTDPHSPIPNRKIMKRILLHHKGP